MRFHEIANVRIPLSGEEQAILRLTQAGTVNRDDLDERQQEVARQMVRRGVLERGRLDGTIVFVDPERPIRRD